MKGLHMVTFILLIVGGLNWLVFGLFGTELGAVLGGMGSGVSRVVYVLVGISAIIEICTHKSMCKCCSAPSSSGPAM